MATSPLINILGKLGGPQIVADEIDWIVDLPAGRDVVNFLSSQTADDAALRDIALEKEECDLWRRAVQAKLVTEDLPSTTTLTDPERPQTVLDYVLPLTYRSQLNDIAEEQALLDRQLNVLSRRLAMERSAINKQKRTQKTAAAAHNQASSSISQIEEQLSELSMHADATISSAVQTVSQVVDELSDTDKEDCRHAFQHKTELFQLFDAFAKISSDLSQISCAQLQRDADDPLADCEGFRAEATRLARSIRGFEDKHVEAGTGEDHKGTKNGDCSRKNLPPTEREDGQRAHWVDAVIERAWHRGQADDLQCRMTHFDNIANFLQDDILPPLALIHSSLSMSEEFVERKQVAFQALVDELDDVEADLNVIALPTVTLEQSKLCDTFEASAKILLKKLRHLRPVDLPALVLTDQEDVLSELSDVQARSDSVSNEIAGLCSAISSDLKLLNAPPQHYLAALTAHSPMPGSPPLALPSQVQDQVSRAHKQIDAVASALALIPEDFAKDSRVRRKLDAFVETHGRG